MMAELRDLISPNRPWIHLLYLGMFFLGWIYRPPGAGEIALSLVAMAGFVAMYIYVMRRMDWTIYPAAIAATVLGLVFLPHTLGGAVYLVFAAAMLGRLPWDRTLALAFSVLAVVGATAVWWMADSLLLAVAALAIGLMTAIGSVIAARREREAARADIVQARAARDAAEAERQRIARDLHDLLGHTLSVVTLKAEIAERLLDADPARARDELAAIQSISREALSEVREAVIGLRGRSLVTALAEARERLADAGLDVTLESAEVDLPEPVSTALSMAVREAATNILRHAGARRAELRLEAGAGQVRLTVSDDGRGGADASGGGLSGLSERLADLGGSLDLSPFEEAGGTRLIAALPFEETADA